MLKIWIMSLLLLLLAFTTESKVVLVYTINRHGARNFLRKDANLTESDANGGPTLLPQGRAAVNAAGSAFRRRYIDLATCDTTCLASTNATLYGVYGTPSTGFTNYNTWVRSSGLDRAILSANGFMAGVFPPIVQAENATAALMASSYANSQVHYFYLRSIGLRDMCEASCVCVCVAGYQLLAHADV